MSEGKRSFLRELLPHAMWDAIKEVARWLLGPVGAGMVTSLVGAWEKAKHGSFDWYVLGVVFFSLSFVFLGLLYVTRKRKGEVLRKNPFEVVITREGKSPTPPDLLLKGAMPEEINLRVGQPVNLRLGKIPKDAPPGTKIGPFKFNVRGPKLGLKEVARITSASILSFAVQRDSGAPPYPSSVDAATWSQQQAALRTYDAETMNLFRKNHASAVVSTHDELLKRGFQDPALDRLFNDPATTEGIRVIGQKIAELAENLPEGA